MDLELQPGPAVFVGPNGQGKTNLVEAVGYLATLGSHRVATDAPLVRQGCTQAVVRARLAREDRELLVECEINPAKINRVRVNRSALSKPRDLLGLVRAVLFAPEDLALVRGDPGERRRFLDELLVTRSPRYAAVRQDYDRVLKQRNALLKTARLARGDALRTLDVWDGHLASAGAALLAGRLALVAELAPYVSASYAAIAGTNATPSLPARAKLSEGHIASNRATQGSPDSARVGSDRALSSAREGGVSYAATISYESSTLDGSADSQQPLPDPPHPELSEGHIQSNRASQGSPDTKSGGAGIEALTEAIRDALARVRSDELDRGITLVGPHRDELRLRLGDTAAKGFASHGESWSFALALKLGAYDLLRADGVEPILILDDVFAELDSRRRSHLSGIAAGAEQTLVTAAVAEDVPDSLAGTRFLVNDGEVHPVA